MTVAAPPRRTLMKIRILDLIDDGAETSVEIAAEMQHSIHCISAYLHRLTMLGAVKRVGLFRIPGRKPCVRYAPVQRKKAA